MTDEDSKQSAAQGERAHALYESGRALFDAGKYEEASDHFEQSAAVFPHFKTLELMGEAWLRRGDPLRALVPLAAATTLNRQVRAPSLLSEALLALGKELEAHEMALIALEREPNNKRAKAVYGATLARYTAWANQ